MALPNEMTSTPTIVFLDLPPKTFVGINLASFDSSPNFHGIKNLSDGLHFVYTGTDASLAVRHGLWLRIRKASAEASLVILRWNSDHEYLVELDDADDEVQSAKKRIAEKPTRGLVDYVALTDASAKLQNKQSKTPPTAGDEDEDEDEDDQTSHTWPLLTSHLTPRILTRVLSPRSTSPRTAIPWSLTSISSAPSDTENIPGLSSTESQSVLEPLQTLDLLPIDLKKTWPDTAQGRTRTDMARDRSWYLSHLVSSLTAPSAGHLSEAGEISQARAAKELLGELQFCFLMVLCLANYSCLEQWKRILSVLFTCRTALVEAETYFVEAVKVLRQQLGRVEDVEGGLFELADEVSSGWLRKLLRTFGMNVEEVYTDANEDTKEKGKVKEVGKQLTIALEELEKWLRDKYGWEDEKNVLKKGMVQLEDGEMIELQHDDLDEEEETGEYAPVIVET